MLRKNKKTDKSTRCKKYNYLEANGVVVGITQIVTIIIWSILTIY